MDGEHQPTDADERSEEQSGGDQERFGPPVAGDREGKREPGS